MNRTKRGKHGRRSSRLRSQLLIKIERKITKSHKINISKALALTLATSLSLLLVPANAAQRARAATIDQQIGQVTNSLNAKQAQANSLQNEIAAIDSQVAAMQAQIDKTQSDIDATTAAVDSLNAQIAENQAELKKQQKMLGEYLKVIYEDSNVSTIEKIAGANSFSDFVDKTEYLQAMQLKVKQTVDRIKEIQKQLDGQKADLKKKMGNLQAMQRRQVLEQQGLNNQRALKDNLLAQANADAANLQGQLNNLHAQMAAMSAQFSESVVASGGGGGYPYGNPPQGNLIDTPDAYGYLIGECTSYAAWWRAVHGRPVPRAMGNAAQWAGMANGGPAPGAVAVFPYIGGYGHVAIVEAVYGNGTILISEYNWTPYSYDERVVNPYDYGIVYIN